LKRPDLQALDDDALAALGNRGLVKRARKLLERDAPFEFNVEQDSTVVVSVEEATTRLQPSTPLHQCPCTCQSQKVCRHRIFAVMVYNQLLGSEQEREPWDPGLFEEEQLKALVGPSTYRQAEKLAKKSAHIELSPGAYPTAKLSTCTVTFLAPGELQFAKCDCSSATPCEHVVLAVWAFRRRQAEVELGETEATLPPETGILLEQLILEGFRNTTEEQVTQLARNSRRLRKLNLVWMADLGDDLGGTLKTYQTRAAQFSLELSFHLIVEWFARERALHSKKELSAAYILGTEEAPETALDHIRLSCLGLELSQTEEGTESRFFLAEPNTSTVLVLKKRWPGKVDILRRSVTKGVKVSDLATGQLVSNSIKRKANRSLVVGRSRTGQTQVFQHSGRWDELFKPPLLVSDYQALRHRLDSGPPSFLRRRLLARDVVVLKTAELGEPIYDPAEQTLRTILTDEKGANLLLELEHNPLTPHALPALDRALSEQPALMSGRVRSTAQGLVFTPFALVTDRIVVPALASESPGWSPLVGKPADRIDPTQEIFLDIRDLLAQAAHRGLKFTSARVMEKMERLASLCSESALPQSEAHLREFLHHTRKLCNSKGGAEEAFRAWLNASLWVATALS